MKFLDYQEALDAFADQRHEYVVEPLKSGLINHSYKITRKINGEPFLLQQINPNVFPKPEAVLRNYELLWNHLQYDRIPFVIPKTKSFADGSSFFIDRHKHYWRAFEFIKGTETRTIAGDADQARAVAETFAGFTACFKNFKIERLQKTIPDFHNLSSRFKQFINSLHSGNFERLGKGAALVDELKKREHYVNFYEVLLESDEFPLRVMHHDAKIANVLFEQVSGRVACPIDFDTAMPGYFYSDLGDMIRSMACNHDENNIAFSELTIRKDFYEAIVAGYLSIMDKQFTPSEKKYIHYSGIIMLYMQALRFLTDFMNSDKYYKTYYKDQNFDRAKNQFILLQKLEEFLLKNYQFKV